MSVSLHQNGQFKLPYITSYFFTTCILVVQIITTSLHNVIFVTKCLPVKKYYNISI